MNEEKHVSRRSFLQSSALAAAGVMIPSAPLLAANDITKTWQSSRKPGFTLWQIPSHRNTIGNSYVFRTNGGKLIVMDGGMPEEEMTLRGFLGALGNEVEAWFVSHPHRDHMGALTEILKNPQDLKIKVVYHSRIREEVIKAEPTEEESCREFYKQIDRQTDIKVVDIQEPGQTFHYDDMSLKILSVATGLTKNPYNNNSMIMRVWDKKKSMVFLGDAGIECGDLCLNGPYGKDLDCEYLQMAHHGQNGCSEKFYQSIRFRVCLWPTPSWVWDNDQGRGFNSGILKTCETRLWMDRIGIKEHHVSCRDGLWRLD